MKKRDQRYLDKLRPRLEELGFQSLEQYLTARLTRTLKEMALELRESYHVFQKFHYRYIKEIYGVGAGSEQRSETISSAGDD